VAHGAVERLLQKVVFTNLLNDTTYATKENEACSGHMADYSKTWLEGFYFQDESVVAQNMTNTQLMEILNPSNDYYGELVNYVYSDSGFSWCDGLDSWFESER
jgi:hypothetical protein